ncbi:MAG: esterase [Mycobacterium sp.]
METQEYAPGRAVDLYGEMSEPTVLLWHGMQTDARAAVRPLAERLAERRFGVVVPDWNSHAADGGRSDLLNSAAFARRFTGAADGLGLVGWSMGGLAAAGLTLHATEFDIPLTHTVCLGGAFIAKDPISGGLLLDGPAPGCVGSPITLLHGVDDDVVPVTSSREFAAALGQVGWPVDVVEIDTDHGAIAGARYDAALDCYLPAEDAPTLAVAAEVAALIAGALGR